MERNKKQVLNDEQKEFNLFVERGNWNAECRELSNAIFCLKQCEIFKLDIIINKLESKGRKAQAKLNKIETQIYKLRLSKEIKQAKESKTNLATKGVE